MGDVTGLWSEATAQVEEGRWSLVGSQTDLDTHRSSAHKAEMGRPTTILYT